MPWIWKLSGNSRIWWMVGNLHTKLIILELIGIYMNVTFCRCWFNIGFKTHTCRRTAANCAAWEKVPETTIVYKGSSTRYMNWITMDACELFPRSFWEDGIPKSTRLMLIVPTSTGGSGRKLALMKMKIPLVPTSTYLETWLRTESDVDKFAW